MHNASAAKPMQGGRRDALDKQLSISQSDNQSLGQSELHGGP